ncbi:MAG: hypothetical protein UV78_C0029G0008 [Parcubacteria group bacterium GW2011_GWA2_43_17]|nr:MAG: hypothetical protein UV78_C0029G0008 [Parcubacteria group bacterium GW2011_GWA2_43_17]KKT94303.1 MAG: hypothetical protein UW91_C0003G0007 [Parcubacteria group bacterium GW2011_GWF2_45_11]KKT97616.1 MAG: hypothetical protein UW98_C0015G0008 [Parcubacteria group bacterium GW2011_GWC2_45_15]OGY93924.1 MAG: hypothetical protein A3J95_01635 [Candidatus Komeilibacteria bacterium RIFOXYC2_FULL_45_12]OGY94225.1 MAG: hypothetical protein A2260_02720 [Candidatus Komeilibacteria bacterium RIFOXYA
MLNIWLYALSSVLAVSLVSIIGIVTVALKEYKLKKILIFFVSFSAGGLLGGAFLHMLPEVIESVGYSLSLVLGLIGGLLLFFVIEKYIQWRHCHEPTSSSHPHHLGLMNLVGDAFHNFLDGLIIAAAYLVSPSLGLATTLAIIFHEIPQEIADFGVLLHAGYKKSRAIFLNLISALLAVAGTIIGLLIGSGIESFSALIIPVAAGGFIYIATADLIPELHKETKMSRSLWQLVFIIAGVAVMYFLTLME